MKQKMKKFGLFNLTKGKMTGGSYYCLQTPKCEEENLKLLSESHSRRMRNCLLMAWMVILFTG